MQWFLAAKIRLYAIIVYKQLFQYVTTMYLVPVILTLRFYFMFAMIFIQTDVPVQALYLITNFEQDWKQLKWNLIINCIYNNVTWIKDAVSSSLQRYFCIGPNLWLRIESSFMFKNINTKNPTNSIILLFVIINININYVVMVQKESISISRHWKRKYQR